MEKRKIGIVITEREVPDKSSFIKEVISGYLCYYENEVEIGEEGNIFFETCIEQNSFTLTIKEFDDDILEVSAGLDISDALLISKELKDIGYPNVLIFNDMKYFENN